MIVSRWGQLGFGVAHVLTAALIVVGVFGGLPTRWLPIDAPALLLVVLHGAAAAALIGRHLIARTLAKVAAFASLGLGLLLIALLVGSASYLSGVYGPVGRGGALIMVLVVALAVPYLVALPAGELLWLGKAPPSSAKPAANKKPRRNE